MKRLFYILLALLALASCTPRMDNVTSAAMDIYSQYKDHSESLTVAFVGDYENGGQTYNAVMFQTADSAEWEWLKEEFGVFSMDEVRASGTTSGVMTSHGDGTGKPSALEEDAPQGMMMGTIEVDPNRDFKDTAEFLAYIDSLTYEMLREAYGDSIAKIRHRPAVIMDLDGMPDEMSAEKVATHQEINRLTREHGRVSYLVNVDSENQTLWLFFYDIK